MAMMVTFRWTARCKGNPSVTPCACALDRKVASLYADWCKHGVAAIEKVRQERPADYLKIIASIIPKEVHVRERSLEDMSDEELSAMIDMLRNSIASVKH
jgi:hypothetical protein